MIIILLSYNPVFSLCYIQFNRQLLYNTKTNKKNENQNFNETPQP